MYWRLIFSGAVLCFWAVQPRSLWPGAIVIADGFEARVVGSFADGWHAPDGLLTVGNELYLADEAGSTVWRWLPGQPPAALGTSAGVVQSPEDMVRDAAGNLYFTDDDAGGVWQITPAGECSLLAGPQQGLDSTEGLALLPDGDLLVGEGRSHKLFRVNRQGEVAEFVLSQAINKAESIVCDREGTIYIADDTAHVVYRVTSSGEVTVLIDARDGLQTCESLCWSEGGLYITDDQAGKLYRWTPQRGLATIAQSGGRLKNVQGVTVGPAGAVYLSIQASLARREGYIIAIEPSKLAPLSSAPL